MSVIEITERTAAIDTGRTYIPYYKLNDSQVVLMDSGFAGELELIELALSGKGLVPAAVVNSHLHEDHVANNKALQARYGAKVYMTNYAEQLSRSLLTLNDSYWNPHMRGLEKAIQAMSNRPDHIFDFDDREIEIYGEKFGLYYTPGHSSDHMSIMTPDGVLYLGDALAGRRELSTSKLLYASLLKENLKTIPKIPLISAKRYVVAHKGIYDSIDEIAEKNTAYYRERISTVFDVLRSPRTAHETVMAVAERLGIAIWNVTRYSYIEMNVLGYMEFLVEIGACDFIWKNRRPQYVQAAARWEDKFDEIELHIRSTSG